MVHDDRGETDHSAKADRELAARFRDGSEDAVRAVYRRFAGPVMTVAMAALRDRELADEAVQQTFLNAWRAADRFDPDRELAPWLYAIARRVTIDLYRREQRRPPIDDGQEADAAVMPPSFERSWEAWQVRTALRDLPGDEREIVALTHFEGLSQREIAERLGIPLGTVKSRSRRAHQRLAEHLSYLRDTVR